MDSLSLLRLCMNVLYWLRSDLRLHDNPCLLRFAEEATCGQILWCSSRSQRRAGVFRRSFLFSSLATLKVELESRGAQVQVEDRDIRTVLPELLQQQAFDRIVFQDEPCSEEVEDALWVRSLGVPCESFEGRALFKRADLPFAIEELPEVFTSFRKKVEAQGTIAAPLPTPRQLPGPRLEGRQPGLSLAAITARVTHHHAMIQAGEVAGRERLDTYLWTLDRLPTYKTTRDGLLEWNDSSKLSPWLAIGALSPRLVYQEIQRYENERIRNESTYWLGFELLWRDYFHWIALKWGRRLFTGMRATLRGERKPLDLWIQGKTGQPFIDAHMNELRLTGWMSNRGRQNAANYLVKSLGGDWRLGAANFEEQLIDYDPASNWGNWAYQAGVGQDPRDRRFDPTHQASLYDPEGLYIQRWNPPL